MICGLWLVASNGTDAAKVDLCPGMGQWRIQHLDKHEYIIGMHSYVLADDESCVNTSLTDDSAPSKNGGLHKEAEGSWIDSLGFIVYKFGVVEPPQIPKRPRGRPRKYPPPLDSD